MEIMVHPHGFGQMFGVPNLVVDQYLKLATPSQLKVLLYLLRHSGQAIGQDEIARAVGISEELTEEALLFWSQTTLFESPTTSPSEKKAEAASQPNAPTRSPSSAASAQQPTASSRRSSDSVVLPSSKSSELSPLEITAALEDSDDLKMLFQMAEQQMGRPLRHVEQRALVWMHDYNNFGSDVILTVLLYCMTIDKPSVSYAETMITNWWNEGIRTLSQVNDAICRREHRRSFTSHIQRTFEMQRKPTPKQQEFIDKWQDLDIPLELITYAYEKTLENIDKLSFPYINSILETWIAAGYRTRKDVDTYDHKKTEDKKTAGGVPESENAEAYQSFYYNLPENV